MKVSDIQMGEWKVRCKEKINNADNFPKHPVRKILFSETRAIEGKVIKRGRSSVGWVERERWRIG